MHTDTNPARLSTTEPACVLVSDSDGEILWASPATTAVLGYPDLDSIEGSRVETLLGDSVVDPPVAGSHHQHYDILTPSSHGEQRPLSVTVTALPAPTESLIYHCSFENDGQFGTPNILSRVADGIVAFDTEWHYTYVNDFAEELLGYDREALLGETAWDVFPAATKTQIRSTLERSMSTQRPVDLEWQNPSSSSWFEVRAFPSETGLSVHFQDITERKEREAALQTERDLTDQLLRLSPMGICVHTPDSRFVRVNERAEAIIGVSSDELIGQPLNAAEWDALNVDGSQFPPEAFPYHVVRRTGEPTFGTEMSLPRPDGSRRWLSVSAAPLFDDSGEIARVIVAFEDITERKTDERRLAAQHDQLHRLNEINDLIRSVNRAIVGETDRDTIEERVCDGLVRSERYPVAMTARLTADERMQVDHAAGLSPTQLATIRDDGLDCIEATMCQASRERTATVLPDQHESEAFRELAADTGIETLLTVPIDCDGVVYGVLTVGAVDADAFGDREQAVFVELGQLLGEAIDAVQIKKLLYATAFLELELSFSPPDDPLAELNDTLGGRWSLDGVIPVEDHRYLLYVEGKGFDAESLEAAANDVADIETFRLIGTGSHPVVELCVGDETPVGAVLDAGGWIQGGTITNGVSEFLVDITLDTDVRAYLDRVQRSGFDVTLRSKREVERHRPATWDTHQTDTELTDRQRTVLKAAYFSGYFDWPRRQTTGEALSESLDISSSTFHQHLRVASEKVFRQYFAVESAQR